MRMKRALVTGASSGIGKAITEMLLKRGDRVYGLARNVAKSGIQNANFYPLGCDLRDLSRVEKTIAALRRQERHLDLVINCAGMGLFDFHERLSPAAIAEMVTVNLTAPLIIASLLLQDLKKNSGIIINIASITAQKASPMGSAYSATKAGLLHFGRSLFEEVRRSGVKVVTICPDIVQTNFFKNAPFKEGDREDAFLTPQCIADAVAHILGLRAGSVITEIVLRPQRHLIVKKEKGTNST